MQRLFLHELTPHDMDRLGAKKIDWMRDVNEEAQKLKRMTDTHGPGGWYFTPQKGNPDGLGKLKILRVTVGLDKQRRDAAYDTYVIPEKGECVVNLPWKDGARKYDYCVPQGTEVELYFLFTNGTSQMKFWTTYKYHEMKVFSLDDHNPDVCKVHFQPKEGFRAPHQQVSSLEGQKRSHQKSIQYCRNANAKLQGTIQKLESTVKTFSLDNEALRKDLNEISDRYKRVNEEKEKLERTLAMELEEKTNAVQALKRYRDIVEPLQKTIDKYKQLNDDVNHELNGMKTTVSVKYGRNASIDQWKDELEKLKESYRTRHDSINPPSLALHCWDYDEDEPLINRINRVRKRERP